MALLTEGEPCYTVVYKHGPPEEGEPRYTVDYKHGPPDGGRTGPHVLSTNMALLAEGAGARMSVYKHGPPGGGRTLLHR